MRDKLDFSPRGALQLKSEKVRKKLEEKFLKKSLILSYSTYPL